MGEGIHTINSGQRGERESSRLKSIDAKSLNRTLGRVGRYTDENYHNEARLTLSKYFKYNDLTKRYNRYTQGDGMTMDDLNDRYKADQELYNRIKKDYGEGVLRKVQQKL